MCLNPVKCKVLAVDFLHYNSYQCPPIATCGIIVEQVESFKFLGVYISHDLTWAVHVDYIVKKANRRLYALSRRLNQIYWSLVRSILEYASPVFTALPLYLSDTVERIQKRALDIVFPGVEYNEALDRTNLVTLHDRRIAAYRKFVSQLNRGNPVHNLVSSRLVKRSSRYNLRSDSSCLIQVTTTKRFSNFVTNEFAGDLI